MCVSVQVSAGAHRSQKRSSAHLELELEVTEAPEVSAAHELPSSSRAAVLFALSLLCSPSCVCEAMSLHKDLTLMAFSNPSYL